MKWKEESGREMKAKREIEMFWKKRNGKGGRDGREVELLVEGE